MILKRETLQYKGQVLIEKVNIQPPFRHRVIFQQEGCFIYVNGAVSKFHSQEEQLSVASKEAVLLKCGPYFVDWLRQINEKPIEVFAVHLYPDVLRDLYSRELPSQVNFRKRPGRIKKVIPGEIFSMFIKSVDFYLQHPALANEDLLELKIRELILLLTQTQNAGSIHQLLGGLFAPVNVSLQEVVQLHLYSTLSVQDLARLCRLSPSSFKRKFRELYDDSPMSYIQKEKIKKAKKLLEITEFSISDIAYDTGFTDPAYFARLFKNKTGYSPSAFRKKYRLSQIS